MLPEAADMDVAEDASMLRKRTGRLAALLQRSAASSVCIISHKGYLRELERGPLGRPAASEFSNCEVRIYDIVLSDDGEMSATLRFCRGEPPSSLSITAAPCVVSAAENSMAHVSQVYDDLLPPCCTIPKVLTPSKLPAKEVCCF